ncbi:MULTISPECIES: HEAT repeat domain-containing protein [Nocardia]|uniref:HEAT repeat domain-containing protein n=1 Tax=Nocardia TaxID=1817 RepID=UPI00135747EE|nr:MULTISPECIES: HEAT repeat domain-containing protein [Nocardia]
MNTKDGQVGLRAALEHSRSDEGLVRLRSIAELSTLISETEARRRLVEMLDDDVVTMQIEAAEALVRYGGQVGLLSVLEELGRRDDGDVDYIAYRLSDLDNLGEFPVLETASSIAESDISPNARRGLQDLHDVMGR